MGGGAVARPRPRGAEGAFRAMSEGDCGCGGGSIGRRAVSRIIRSARSVVRALMDRIVELEDDNTGLRMRVHELAAGKKAAKKQAREERKALVDMGADLAGSLAREARAVESRDEAVREKEEAVREMADERSSNLCDQATLKARLELEAARREQAAGAAGGGRAGDLMSRPGPAVSQSQSQSPQQQQAGRGKKEDGDEGGGGAQPRLALSNSSVAVPYNGTAAVRASAAAGAEGPATIELSSIDPLGGAAAPAPAFASVEYVRSDGNATESLIVLTPNATDVGVHEINVTARWAGGAPPAHAVLLVNVTDGVPPVLHAPARAALEAAGRLTAVNASTVGVWAADEADPSPVLLRSPSGPLPVGAHDVLWTATDVSNNTASAWMRLTVRDTTPPALGSMANLALSFSGVSQPWANYTAPAALDAVDGADVRVRCLPAPGSPVQRGLTQVVCVALDSQGNAAWARFWLNATGTG